MASSEAACSNGSIHTNLQNLENISFKRILMENTDQKIVFVEGRVKNSDDPAVLIIEKLPWKQEDIQGLLSKDTSASQQFNMNNVLCCGERPDPARHREAGPGHGGHQHCERHPPGGSHVRMSL